MEKEHINKNRKYVILALQLLGPLVAAYAIINYATLPLMVLSLAMFFLMKCVGVTITYHRILCHRTHTMHPAVEAICTTLGFYGSSVSPIEFSGLHVNHHKFVDTDDDPHYHYRRGWRTLIPALWNYNSKSMEAGKVILRLRRNKVANFYDVHFYKMLFLPTLLLLFSPMLYLFGYWIPVTMSMWAGTYATFNHDETGAVDRGWLFGVLTMGEHKHKWHHDNPFDTSGEGWLDTVINLIAKKRVT